MLLVPARRTLIAIIAALLLLPLAGGAATPAEATTDFRFEGRGNGHGIGMSQYGAEGQARDGRSAAQILGSYYRGTGLATKQAPHDLRIGVVLDQPRTQVVTRGGTVDIHIGDTTYASAAGQVWDIKTLGSGRCRITHPDGTTQTDWYGEATRCLVADPREGARVEVRRPAGGQMVTHHQYSRSSIVEVFRDEVGEDWRLDVVVETPMEEYLYGLAEMPYSWEPAALQAQAVAGRSYALHRLLSLNDATPDRGCMCHLYDSQQDQVWHGWGREQSSLWARWRTAVDSTAGRVVHAPGAIGTRDGVVQAFYSSSSNGRTEAKHELWGGAVFPYLVSVDDPWSRRSFNPFRAWQAGAAGPTIAAKVGLDEVDSIRVTNRSTSSAATRVVFRGRDAGADTEVARTGSWVRTALGLRSTTIDRIFLPPFTDDDGNMHESAIAWLAGSGITAGCNPPTNDRYCPEAGVTRGQMAAFLTRALELEPGPDSFGDDDGSIFEADINALAAADITRGCNPPANDRFCPEQTVTREQMASFLARALGLPRGPTGSFRDVPSGSTHERNIGALAEADITRGCNPPDNTRFCPGAAVTRAQMATFLFRGLDT